MSKRNKQGTEKQMYNKRACNLGVNLKSSRKCANFFGI